MTITCLKPDATVAPTRSVQITGCGATWTGTTATLQFTDNDPTNGATQYEVTVDGVVRSTATVTAPATSIQLENLPTDGENHVVCLRGPSGTTDSFTAPCCNFVAATVVEPERSVQITGCGATWTGTTATINFTDNDATNGATQYEVTVDGVVRSTATVTAPATSIQLENLPTDGASHTVCLRGPSGTTDSFSAPCCNFVAAAVVEPERSVQITGCGATWTGTTATLNFTDNDATNGVTQYEVTVDGVVRSAATVTAPATSIQLENLPTDGASHTVCLRGPSGTTDSFSAPCCNFTASTAAEITINDCGTTLTGSSKTFTWNDPGSTAQTRKDFCVGSTSGACDIYDHAGGGVFNGTSVTVSNIPVDGRVLYITLYNSRAGDFSDTTEHTCTFTAFTDTSVVNRKDFDFGSTNVAEGSVTDAKVDTFIPGGMNYSNGEEYLSITNGGSTLVHRQDPTSNGSTRTDFGSLLTESPQCMRITQTVLWQSPADYGGPSNQTNKVGFGFGSVNYVSGSTVDPSGFSFRMIGRNGNWKGYSYASDRPGAGLTVGSGVFGEDVNNGTVVPITPGSPQTIVMTLCLNTGSNANGSILVTVDGVQLHEDNAVRWLTSNHNMRDCRFQAFFGGGDSSWSPGSSQRLEYSNVSYEILS